MGYGLKLQLLTAGFWLGVCQVGLAFHLLFSQGASIVNYFLLVATWLIGSAAGLCLKPDISLGRVLVVAALVMYGLNALIARSCVFDLYSLASIVLSVVVVSSFAGWILHSAVVRGARVSQVMLFENIGFVIGYAVAATCLFFFIVVIDLISLAAGLMLFALLMTQPGPEKNQ